MRPLNIMKVYWLYEKEYHVDWKIICNCYTADYYLVHTTSKRKLVLSITTYIGEHGDDNDIVVMTCQIGCHKWR